MKKIISRQNIQTLNLTVIGKTPAKFLRAEIATASFGTDNRSILVLQSYSIVLGMQECTFKEYYLTYLGRGF